MNTAALVAGGALVGGSLLVNGKNAMAQNNTMAGMMASNDWMKSNNGMPMDTSMNAGMAAAVFGDVVNFRTDVDILNYALLLEYLEAEFYTRAVAANNLMPFLKNMTPMLAQKLRDDENAHVEAVSQRIRDIGGTPVMKPGFTFPASTMTSETAFLEFSLMLEENGVHAYLGAAPFVKNNAVLRFAASIYGVETRHTAAIRHTTGRLGAPDAFEMPLSGQEIAQRSAPYFVMG